MFCHVQDGVWGRWFRWIKWCISMTCFLVIVNESPNGFFHSPRGVLLVLGGGGGRFLELWIEAGRG